MGGEVNKALPFFFRFALDVMLKMKLFGLSTPNNALQPASGARLVPLRFAGVLYRMRELTPSYSLFLAYFLQHIRVREGLPAPVLQNAVLRLLSALTSKLKGRPDLPDELGSDLQRGLLFYPHDTLLHTLGNMRNPLNVCSMTRLIQTSMSQLT